MELTKYTSNEIMAHIKHDLRQLPSGKTYGNESVDKNLSVLNYSLVDRGGSPTAVNNYRKNFEKNIFKYNRKNLIHAVELVIQCPNDCPREQHDAFFQTAFHWYCDNYLPAGEECVFVAEVHRDEHKFVTVRENGQLITKDISKEHMHIAFVPVIPAGSKHPDYKYRLNADALTKRAILKSMHPSLQKALNDAGIQATVFQKKEDDSKTIPLSVQQLKAITDRTGIVLDQSFTIDNLIDILEENISLKKELELTKNKDMELENQFRNEGSYTWDNDTSWGKTQFDNTINIGGN